MYFKVEFFDGECSVSQNCTLLCDENSKFCIKYNDKHINLEKIAWRKTKTKLFLTSESLQKHAYIAVEAADDQRLILKVLTNLKKVKSAWVSRSFFIYYGIIGLFAALWLFMDSLVFLLPNSIEPWLEKEARLIHFRNLTSIANDSNEPTLKKIKDAFTAIDPDLQGIEIEILQNEQINAVTLPNKKVIIYSKLIENADSIEELIGILAHEMTHVKYRHCIASYIKLSFLSLLDTIVAGGTLSESGIVLYFLQFSRANEMEADEGAIKYLEQLRLSTKGMEKFFKKITEQKTSKSWVPEFFNTHPGSPDRRKLFTAHRKTYKESVFSDNDLKNLKKIVDTKSGG
ncbi:M48 family metallopeptidase [Candidatus Finniella inopinata]|uniref:M48 family metallopeptidase n=1 Tax=Candidatus Finniella inopinata TaxID=1696036 RepID=A0A4Q7DHH8_9PROT|nr:M48 family metallopeptidase [Candidatus Finniella inopinata]RZI45364.1 M48 family metallopeptidase [Candidatus Finniella inopinata]